MFEPIIEAVGFVFSPVTIFSPYIAILIMSVFLTLSIMGLNRLVTNRKLMKELKEKMGKIKENLKQVQKEGDKEKANQLLNEMMKTNGQYMKQTFKALVVSMLVIFLILPWLRAEYAEVSISMPFTLPIIGSGIGWLGWYILVSFSVGWVAQKLLGGYY